MNKAKLQVSVILPTYNERENIAILIKQLSRHLSGFDYEIIVVDDNSPNGTADVARALSSAHPVRVLKRPGKMGITSAIYHGFKRSKGDVIVVMDADLQHPPDLVPKLLSRISECDVVIASRYVSGGKIEKWSLIRRTLSMGAVIATRILVPACTGVRDPVSGFFAIKKDLLASWKPVRPEGYKVLVEILSYAKPKRVCEEPYTFRARREGASKLSGEIVASFVRLLLKLQRGLQVFLVVFCLAFLGVLLVLLLETVF